MTDRSPELTEEQNRMLENTLGARLRRLQRAIDDLAGAIWRAIWPW
jgi:hypothetical protein